MNSLFPLLLTENRTACREFYQTVFGFEVVAELDWYTQLVSPENPAIGLGFMSPDNPGIPDGYQTTPGCVVTIDVDHVDAVWEKAKTAASDSITMEPKDEEWGQRHIVLVDPSGCLVDVVQAIAPSQAFLEANGMVG